jgi:hypothetical protein
VSCVTKMKVISQSASEAKKEPVERTPKEETRGCRKKREKQEQARLYRPGPGNDYNGSEREDCGSEGETAPQRSAARAPFRLGVPQHC